MDTNLTSVELRELWRRYKTTDDRRLRERLVVAYSPLVKYVAGRTAAGLPPHIEEADLISYGLVGLISAIERFDLSRDIKFETYAIMRIKGAIIDELRSLDWVPRSVRARAREVERANAKLERLLQRAPTDAEIAAEMGITIDELNDSLLAISHSSIVALDELWSVSDSTGDQVSLMDTIEDPGAPDLAKALDVGDLKDRIADSITKLPEREKLVVALYYYEKLTLRQIGEVLGVTESRVSQMHTKAVLRLRSRMQEESFDDTEPAVSLGERSGPVADIHVASYLASGGPSGLLTVPAGWAVRAEAHEGSFALVWPARATVLELLAASVGGAESADVVLGLRGEPAMDMTLAEALARVEFVPDEVEFARLDFNRLVLTWSRSRLQLPVSDEREAAYEIGLGAEVFDEAFLVRVLSGTAVKAISESAHALVLNSREILATVPAGKLDSY